MREAGRTVLIVDDAGGDVPDLGGVHAVRARTLAEGREALGGEASVDLILLDSAFLTREAEELVLRRAEKDARFAVAVMTSGRVPPGVEGLRLWHRFYQVPKPPPPDRIAAILAEIDRPFASGDGLISRQDLLLSVVLEVSEIFRSGQDPAAFYDQIVECTCRTLGVEKCSLLLLDVAEGKLRIAAARGIPENVMGEARIPAGEGISGHVLATGKPLLVEDIESDPRFAAKSREGFYTKSLLAVPFKIRGVVRGVLNVNNKRDRTPFGPQDRRILAILASQVAVVAENAELLRETREFNRELDEAIKKRTRELKEAQKQLVQIEKLASLGEMAAAIAHEINNPLGVISNYAQILAAQIEKGEPNEKLLEGLGNVRAEIARMAKVVRSLLQFSREQTIQLGEFNLGSILHAAVERERPRFAGEGKICRVEVAPDLPKISGDRQLIAQVLSNLLENARHALPPKGEVVVEASRLGTEWVQIRVRDNGCGIPEAVVGRIFDPFFTTKGPREGTGLGLSICLAIVDAHQGKISVKSEVGKGTQFDVLLPVDLFQALKRATEEEMAKL